VVDTGTV